MRKFRQLFTGLIALAVTLFLIGCPQPDTGTISGGNPSLLPLDAIQLIADTWADGNIPSSNGDQWFKFTADTATQYVHASFGTLTDFDAHIYNSGGATAGKRVNLYGSTRSASLSLTQGQEYYIRVRPYFPGSGTYRIAFNASTSPPML